MSKKSTSNFYGERSFAIVCDSLGESLNTRETLEVLGRLTVHRIFGKTMNSMRFIKKY